MPEVPRGEQGRLEILRQLRRAAGPGSGLQDQDPRDPGSCLEAGDAHRRQVSDRRGSRGRGHGGRLQGRGSKAQADRGITSFLPTCTISCNQNQSDAGLDYRATILVLWISSSRFKLLSDTVKGSLELNQPGGRPSRSTLPATSPPTTAKRWCGTRRRRK